MELRLRSGTTDAAAEFHAARGLTELNIKHIATLRKPEDIINQALDKPTGSHPFNDVFRGAGNVVIVVPDKSRVSGSEVYLPILRQRLNQLGVADQQISILVATGNHPPQPEAQLLSLFPADILASVKILQHDCHDKRALSYVGETKRGTPIFVNKLVADADHIIVCGTIVHHYFAGFSGGPKMIVPGCAGHESITRNHALAIDPKSLRLHPGCRDGKVEGNPLQEDLREAFKFINVTFLLHPILNGHYSIIGAVGGEPLQAHAAGCRIVDDIYRVPISEQADLVIVSCGGYPKDINYIQAHKSLHHASYAVRPRGTIIFLAECTEGIGSRTFMQWFDCQSSEQLHHELLHRYKINGTTALATMQKARESRIIAVTGLPPEIVRKLGFIPAASLSAALAMARQGLPEHYSAFIMPNGALTVPYVA